MRYNAYFCDINENPYQLRIVTPAQGEDKELTLAGHSPVKIEIDTDLYDYFRGEACTAKFLVDDVFKDMYNSTADGVQLFVYDMNPENPKTIFRGYVTPNEYDQEWLYKSELEIEAVSADSKLQYVDFDFDSIDVATVSFFDIIKHCLVDLCDYELDNIFITNSIGLEGNVPTPGVMKKLKISTLNFYDDDDKKTPWKYNDVLEEILKYLNLSMCIFEDKVYFIDYGALVKGCSVININDETNANQFVPEICTLVADKFRGSAKFSLDETYNKIEVEVNAYPIEKINLDLFTNKDLIQNDYGTMVNPYFEQVTEKKGKEIIKVTYYNIYQIYYTKPKNGGKYADALTFYGQGTAVFISTNDEVDITIYKDDGTVESKTSYKPQYGINYNYNGSGGSYGQEDKTSITKGNIIYLSNMKRNSFILESSDGYIWCSGMQNVNYKDYPTYVPYRMGDFYYDKNITTGQTQVFPAVSFPYYIYEDNTPYTDSTEGDVKRNPSYNPANYKGKLRAKVELTPGGYRYYTNFDGIHYNPYNTFVAVGSSRESNVRNGMYPSAKVYKYCLEETKVPQFISSLDWTNVIALWTGLAMYDKNTDFKKYYDAAIMKDFSLYNYYSVFGSADLNGPYNPNDELHKTTFGDMALKQLSINSIDSYTLSSPVDSYLVLSGSVCIAYSEYKSEVLPGLDCDELKNNKAKYVNSGFLSMPYGWKGDNGDWYGYPCLRMSIKVGNLYYAPNVSTFLSGNATNYNSGTWTSTETVFAVPIGGTDDLKWESWIDITNSVKWNMGLDGVKGFAVKIPANTQLSGQIEITFYTPYACNADMCNGKISDFIYNHTDPHYKDAAYPYYVLVKDFEVTYANQVYKQTGEDYDEDIAYSNIIDDAFVNECDKIKLKVNTQPIHELKKNSYSSVITTKQENIHFEFNGVSYDFPSIGTSFVDKLYSASTQTRQLQEYNIIESRINHYKEPKYIFKTKLLNEYNPLSIVKYDALTQNKLVPIKQNIDIKQKTTDITLIEV